MMFYPVLPFRFHLLLWFALEHKVSVYVTSQSKVYRVRINLLFVSEKSWDGILNLSKTNSNPFEKCVGAGGGGRAGRPTPVTYNRLCCEYPKVRGCVPLHPQDLWHPLMIYPKNVCPKIVCYPWSFSFPGLLGCPTSGSREALKTRMTHDVFGRPL